MSRTKAKPGRPKDASKRHAILEAAANCFLRDGFDGASMDAIAREAGVSKITLYSHFQDKEGLFREMVEDKCAEFAPSEEFAALADAEPREALTRIAGGVVQLITEPDVVAMHRLVVSGAARNPTAARLLYESGPQPMLSRVAALLRAWHGRGVLEVPDALRAAGYLFAMLKGPSYDCLVLNLEPPPSKEDAARHIRDCVDVFLRAYAPARAPGPDTAGG